ncbi:MAG: hypothetical protein OWU32_05340 [Firmicutes bacterium]|nr:hypothetical protein [Bacillota bacterium]
MNKSSYRKHDVYRALFYKEWLQKRLMVAAVVVLLCFRLIGTHGLQSGASLMGSNWSLSVFGLPGLVVSGLVAGLAAYSFAVERHQDAGWFTLSGPVTKRQVLRAKYGFDLGLLAIFFTSVAVVMMVCGDSGMEAARWWVAELAVQGFVYGLALVVGTLVGNAMAVILLVFGLTNVPIYAGVFLVNAFGANLVVFQNPSRFAIPWSWKVMWTITELSPLNWVDAQLTTMWASPWPFLILFLVLSGVALAVAERIYAKVDNERLSSLFAFPWLRHPVTFALTVPVAYVLMRIVTIGSFQNYYGSRIAWVLGISLTLWAIITWSVWRGGYKRWDRAGDS